MTRFRRHNQPAPRRCGHHPRRRPRRISPAAHLPSPRGCGGIPRSLSVLPLDGNAEVIPAELAPRVRHPVPKQLIPTRRPYAECRIPPRPVSPNNISRYVVVPQAVPQPTPRRCGHHPRRRPRRHFRTASSGAPLTSQTPFSRIPTSIEILQLG